MFYTKFHECGSGTHTKIWVPGRYRIHDFSNTERALYSLDSIKVESDFQISEPKTHVKTKYKHVSQ